MKPIRYIIHQNTIWYNVSDYVSLLLVTNMIRRARPASLGKRLRNLNPPDQVLFEKISRLNPAYQIRINEEIYVDWAAFEHLFRLLKPYLVHPTDWANPNSLFRQTQLFINNSRRLTETVESNYANPYFIELKPD